MIRLTSIDYLQFRRVVKEKVNLSTNSCNRRKEKDFDQIKYYIPLNRKSVKTTFRFQSFRSAKMAVCFDFGDVWMN